MPFLSQNEHEFRTYIGRRFRLHEFACFLGPLDRLFLKPEATGETQRWNVVRRRTFFPVEVVFGVFLQEEGDQGNQRLTEESPVFTGKPPEKGP